jgi:glycosyltransferase involved in cell wall biosynthesis
MPSKQKVSIIIPAKNEEKNLPILLKKIRKLYKNKFEIVVIDDASTDKTAESAKKFDVKLVRNDESRGKGYALRTGFSVATGDIIIDIDSDLSHKPEDIPVLLKPLKDKKVGLVIGSRCLGGSEEYGFVRSIGNVLLTGACNFFLGTNLMDALNGYRAFRRDIINNMKCNGFEIEIEIIAHCIKKGYKIMEVPSQEKTRAYGKCKSNNIHEGYKFLKQIIIEYLKLNLGKIIKIE